MTQHEQRRPRLLRFDFKAPWTIFAVAFLLRVACIVIGHTYRVPAIGDHFHFGFEMGRIARSLVQGQGYANPFNGVSGPTAWVPPLYPLLMALAFKLFGVYTAGAAFFLLVVNSLFSAAIAPAVYEIAARCFDASGLARRGSKHAVPVALWSAWLWAVYPAALQYAIHWLWEMSVSTCLFTWAIVVALGLRRVGELKTQDSQLKTDVAPHGRNKLSVVSSQFSVNWQRWLGFGLLWGLIALSNASLLLCLPVMLAWILWPSRTGWSRNRATLLGAALSCVVIALVMSPWIVRNERALHAFVPTRSNMGVELDESLKPEHDAFPYGTALPLWPADPEFRRYVQMGEIRYAHARGEQGKARLLAHPASFVHHTIDRVFFFWDGTPHGDKPVSEFFRELSYSFISLCGLLGVALAVRRRVPAAWMFAGLFLLLPLPYYLITVQPRFRHPLEPLMTVLAVYLFRSTGVRLRQKPLTAG